MRNWIINNFRNLLSLFEVSSQDGFYLVVDSSRMLISNKAFNEYAYYVRTIARKVNIPLHLIYVDHEFQGMERFEPAGAIALRPRGVNGRDFRPAFRYIRERNLHPLAVIYLTDGCSELFPPAPTFSVFWAIIGNHDFEPPFGMKIQIINL